MHASDVTLILTLIFVGAALAVTVVVTLARLLVRPPRMSDGKALWVYRRLSPHDVGLSFDDIVFDIRDATDGRIIRLVGWWMINPAAEGRCVVLIHGYADAKVGVVAWAPLWHSLGFNVLAVDLRAHGESGGDQCAAGLREADDLRQVVNELKLRWPMETAAVVLFGLSLGALTATAVAARDETVRAIVLESPAPDAVSALRSQLEHLGAPGPWLQRASLALAGRLSGVDFKSLSIADLLPRVACPVMIVSPQDDIVLRAAERAAVRSAIDLRNRPEDEFWSLATGNQIALHVDADEYERRLARFLARAGIAVLAPDGPLPVAPLPTA